MTASALDENTRLSAWRSQCGKLAGRTVLLVGGADILKRCVWESARTHGVRLLLVADRWPLPPELGLGHETVDAIVVPRLNLDHSEEAEQAHCEDILRQLARKGLRPDGVLTVWEECTVLAAMLAERLGLRGNPVAAQRRAKSKLETYRTLLDGKAVADTLTVPFVDLGAPADVHSASARSIRYPAIVKWHYGAGSLGTFAVSSPAEAEQAVGRVMDLLSDPVASSQRYAGVCFAFGSRRSGVLLMDYIEGSEHDVDLLLFDGQLIDAVVTDNASIPPNCAETCALMPSALPAGQQARLIAAAHQACLSLGLANGAVNVELMLSPQGPKVIEVNGRMGGVYISAWMKEIWSFDLPAAALMIACGIRPVGRVARSPRLYLAGVTCFADDGSSPHAPLDGQTLRVDYKDDPADAPVEYPYMCVGFRGASAPEAVAEANKRLPALFADDPERARLLGLRLAALAGA